MALWEISLRARWDYPFIELSGRFPDTPISMWCVWNRELLQVPTREPEVLRAIEKEIRAAGRVVDQWMDARSGRLFLLQCTCAKYNSIWNIADAHECIESPPSVFQDGWGYFRLIAFDDRKTGEIFRDLHARGPAELLKKRELPLSTLPTTVWVQSLFSDLTRKQVDAILAAHRNGYYASPRRVTTDVLAGGIGVARTTYEEHLRKAENRVLDALLPYLKLYATADHPAETSPSPRPPVKRGPRRAGGGVAA